VVGSVRVRRRRRYGTALWYRCWVDDFFVEPKEKKTRMKKREEGFSSADGGVVMVVDFLLIPIAELC